MYTRYCLIELDYTHHSGFTQTYSIPFSRRKMQCFSEIANRKLWFHAGWRMIIARNWCLSQLRQPFFSVPEIAIRKVWFSWRGIIISWYASSSHLQQPFHSFLETCSYFCYVLYVLKGLENNNYCHNNYFHSEVYLDQWKMKHTQCFFFISGLTEHVLLRTEITMKLYQKVFLSIDLIYLCVYPINQGSNKHNQRCSKFGVEEKHASFKQAPWFSQQ